jgi:DDB1- and CUL4-associated factor 11
MTDDVFLSGGDDNMIKIWDKRTLKDSSPQGYFIGHTSGITCLSTSSNGYQFISNSKDQTLKLWDIRKMKTEPCQLNQKCSNGFHW